MSQTSGDRYLVNDKVSLEFVNERLKRSLLKQRRQTEEAQETLLEEMIKRVTGLVHSDLSDTLKIDNLKLLFPKDA